MRAVAFAENRLSIGRVVGQTIRVLGRNIVAVAAVCVTIAMVSAGFKFWVDTALAAAGPHVVVTARAHAALGSVIDTILNGFTAGAITHLAASDAEGARAGIGSAFVVGARRMLPLLGLNFVLGFGIGFASLLLIVPGAMLAMRWMVAQPVRVVEGGSVGESLTRSSELTKGSRWRLFAVALVLFMLMVVVVFVGGVVVVLSARSGGLAATVGRAAGGFLVVAGYIAISSAGLTMAFVELRRLREGATPGQLAAVFA